MKIDLSGKTALVTGSTSGIGHAIASGLAAAGATVVVNGRTQGKVDAAVAAIAKRVAGAKVRGAAADVSTAVGCKTLTTALTDVDILINNAGIFEPKGFFDIPDEDWTRFYEVNVMSGVRLSRAYMPGMLKRNWGRVVFISSESALSIPKEMIHYGMTKTAQLSVSRGLADDPRHRGDGQFGAAGPDHVGGRGNIRQRPREAKRPVGGGGGGALRQAAPPDVFAGAVRQRRRDRQYGGLYQLEGGLRDQRRGASGRGRHHPDHRVR